LKKYIKRKYQCENFDISVDCLRIGVDVHNTGYFIAGVVSKGIRTQRKQQELFQTLSMMGAHACLEPMRKPSCHSSFNLPQTLGISDLATAEAWGCCTLLSSPCSTHHNALWQDKAAYRICMSKSRGSLMAQHVQQIKVLWLLGRMRT